MDNSWILQVLKIQISMKKFVGHAVKVLHLLNCSSTIANRNKNIHSSMQLQLGPTVIWNTRNFAGMRLPTLPQSFGGFLSESSHLTSKIFVLAKLISTLWVTTTWKCLNYKDVGAKLHFTSCPSHLAFILKKIQ